MAWKSYGKWWFIQRVAVWNFTDMAGLILQLFITHSTKFELIWTIFFSYLKVQFTNMHKQFTYYLDFLYSQHALTAEVVSSKLSIKGNILFMLFNFSMKKTRLNFVFSAFCSKPFISFMCQIQYAVDHSGCIWKTDKLWKNSWNIFAKVDLPNLSKLFKLINSFPSALFQSEFSLSTLSAWMQSNEY